MKFVTILLLISFICISKEAYCDEVSDTFERARRILYGTPQEETATPEKVSPPAVTLYPKPDEDGGSAFTLQPPKPSPTPPAADENRESFWDVSGLTTGIMALRQSRGMIAGNYPEDRGEIDATISESLLIGYWIEDASGQRCTAPRNGRYFWGRVQALFKGDSFTGKWGYCEAQPTNDWSGKRRGSP